VQQCRHIHYTLLNEVDPQLSMYLRDLQIEPHLYALRWVRIMLAQVFPLHEILILWDAILAFDNNVQLLDWLCVAMLVNIRHLILGKDYSSCMQLLFNYTQTNDPRYLVATAIQLQVRYQQLLNTPNRPPPSPNLRLSVSLPPTPTAPSASSRPTSPTNASSKQQQQPPKPKTDKKSILEPLTSTFKSMFAEDPLYELQKLRDEQIHTANRLDRVVYSLQNLQNSYAVGDEDQTNNDNTSKRDDQNDVEILQQAIEELIQIKEVLMDIATSGERKFSNKSNSNSTINNIYNFTPISNELQQKQQTPQVENNVVETNASNTQEVANANNNNNTANIYERVLSIDPLSIFRSKK